MPLITRPPTDQRAGVRPIAFLLDAFGALSRPVYLQIRPEDMTVSEPSRTAVHQTLGRDVIGWVDNFGQGLPTISISGHTGWRTSSFSGMDGAQSFEELHALVTQAYPRARQTAIDSGLDPAGVRLVFSDVLDGFAYSVAPMNFTLRRSKSRPLLFQYQMQLQATSGATPPVPVAPPNFGNPANALLRLSEISGGNFFVNAAKIFPALKGLIDRLKGAVDFILNAAGAVTDAVNAACNLALDLARAALNSCRTLIDAINAPAQVLAALKGAARQVISTFHEIVCLFSNALRPRKIFQSYNGLFGASNCSSTVGGRPPSAYANTNVFGTIFDGTQDKPAVTPRVAEAVRSLADMDSILAPMAPVDVTRNLDIIAEAA